MTPEIEEIYKILMTTYPNTTRARSRKLQCLPVEVVVPFEDSCAEPEISKLHADMSSEDPFPPHRMAAVFLLQGTDKARGEPWPTSP